MAIPMAAAATSASFRPSCDIFRTNFSFDNSQISRVHVVLEVHVKEKIFLEFMILEKN